MDIEEVKKTVSKGLDVARWRLLNKCPFIGEMLLRFNIIPVYDARLNTAATDGKNIYFDCEFYSNIDDGEREFVLAHEVWHNIFMHFLRQQCRDRNLWNVATDMEINHMLRNEGLKVLKDALLPDPAVAGQNAEDIYAYLQKNMNSDQNKNGKKNGGGQGDNGSSSSSSSNGSDSSDSSSSSSNGKNQKDKGQFDKHIYGDGTCENPQEEKDGKWGKKGIDKNFCPQIGDVKEVENSIREAVCSAAQSIERSQGSLPGNLDKIIKEILKPEINWKEALSMFYTNCLDGDHSWRRCSRHAMARGHYLPGKNGEKIKTLVCVDTSGSCLGDVPKFLSELESLAKSFGRYEITLMQVDEDIQQIDYFDDSNPIDLSEGFHAKGFGGTSFKAPFKWIRENDESSYNAIVYLTDGYGNAPTYPPSVPTLWVLTSDGNKDFCDWGEKIQFKPERKM